MSEMHSHIASVDLTGFRTGTGAQRQAVATAIDETYRSTGFLQVTGHGVDQALMDEMLDVTQQFFDLPLTAKEAVVVADKSKNRGYASLGSEALAYSLGEEPAAPDLFEAFNAGRDDVAGAYFDTHRQFFAENVWPTQPAEMADVWRRYQTAVLGLADHLLEAFALALGIDEQFFIERTRRAIMTTRAINYERAAGAPPALPGQMRMGAHSDYGVATVLLADDVPGLQVQHAGAWIDVPVTAGSFIVNIGDMMATWTNDRWVSTLHRVVPPPASASGPVRRRSVAQFLEADPDAIISCLPTCASSDNPPRYEPVNAGDYLLAKLMGPRELRRSELPGHGG